MTERILVVDDEASMRLGVAEVLGRAGYLVSQASNAEDGLAELEKVEHSLVISDMRMPGMGGAGLLRRTRERWPGLPVVLITAYGTVEDAVGAMKEGAREFLTKPFSPQDLIHLVRGILDEGSRESETRTPSPNGGVAPAAGRLRAGNRPIVTSNAEMERILGVAEGVAASRAPVLIEGESGTGKELLARHVHMAGPRRDQNFVAVNCAALPRELLESELFGHERGAFTGAVSKKLGKFELAHRGTILLDEIGEMEPLLQAKLLRVLQEHEIDRVGGDRPIPIDARIIATTNRNLRKMVAAGDFRRDLFYRLNVIPLTIPSLAQRPEDLDPLIAHFLDRLGDGQTVLSPAALDRLRRHSWPGNIRELEHVMERALLLAQHGVVEASDLGLDDEAREAEAEAGAGIESLAGQTVHEVERQLIFETLKRTGNNRSHAARMLGISVRTLRNKLAEYRATGTMEADVA